MLKDDLTELMERNANMRERVLFLINSGKKWDAYRMLYKALLPDIMNRNGNQYGIDPYTIDWITQFTPIENDAWHTIRCLGLPLYPQFPVGRVFVDFGDPVKKIALECDGKAFHDDEKDYLRDKGLSAMGWVVYRAPGRECVKQGLDLGDLYSQLDDQRIGEDEFRASVSQWANSTSEGLISAIGWQHYEQKFGSLAAEYFPESLISHSNFPIHWDQNS